jgi:hypothetical protein
MRLRRLRERIDGRDRHPELRLGHGAVQPGELASPRHPIERKEANPLPATRLGVDSIGVRDPTTRPHHVEAPLELVAARERKDRVEPIGGK